MSPVTDLTDPRMSAPRRLTPPESPIALAPRSGYAHAWYWLMAAVRRGAPAVRAAGAGSGQETSWPLPSDPSSVPTARHLARTQLTDWGLYEHREVAELLVSELVTNALTHATGPIGLTMRAGDGVLRCEVRDTGAARPHVCQPRESDEGGRGLQMVETLSCRWGADHTPDGKSVWFELHPDQDPS
jgi:anti-sigma regulatory factor (Ser/Thr protein kinase)